MVTQPGTGMNLLKSLLLLPALAGSVALAQQPSFNSKAYLDVNRIKAAHLVHGDMWWNPISGEAACEFPKGSGKHARFVTAIWTSCDGLPAGNSFVSAQTFREYSGGNDFWPGPYGTTDYHESSRWAKIWKADRNRIHDFRTRVQNGQTPPPTDLNFAAIYDWPGKGNTTFATDAFGDPLPLKPNTDYAPFADLNHNGIYEPALGEYPDIKGDQMLWWLITDRGPEHTNTGGFGTNVEVRCIAYAYNRSGAVNNMLFYEYDIIPQGSPKNFRFGLFSDGGLGYSFDDYIAFDSARRMEILYNGKSTDGAGQTNSYGSHPPMSAITLLQLPGDTFNTIRPAGAFITYRNDFTNQGHPTTPAEVGNYMKGRWRNGAAITRSCTGIDSARPATPYSFPDLSAVPSATNECACSNVPYDRLAVLSAPPADLQAKATYKYAFALVLTDTTGQQTCPGVDFAAIQAAADTAWQVYYNPPPALTIPAVAGPSGPLKVYPNPARSTLYIEAGKRQATGLAVYNSMGARMPLSLTGNGAVLEVDVASWPAGTYFIRFSGAGGVVQSFIRQ